MSSATACEAHRRRGSGCARSRPRWLPDRLAACQAARCSALPVVGLESLSATTRYQRSPSVFSDSSLSLSFLRTTPAKNPRTLCCCHPVAFMIAAIVVPLGWLNIASTFACLEFERGPAVVAFLAGATVRRPLPEDVLVLALLFF